MYTCIIHKLLNTLASHKICNVAKERTAFSHVIRCFVIFIKIIKNLLNGMEQFNSI